MLAAGKNVWHDGSQFASLKVLNQQTCALIMADDDVRGYLSADGQEIDWEDGDCWKRAKMEQHKGQQSFATPTRTSPHKSQIEPANNAWVKNTMQTKRLCWKPLSSVMQDLCKKFWNWGALPTYLWNQSLGGEKWGGHQKAIANKCLFHCWWQRYSSNGQRQDLSSCV